MYAASILNIHSGTYWKNLLSAKDSERSVSLRAIYEEAEGMPDGELKM